MGHGPCLSQCKSNLSAITSYAYIWEVLEYHPILLLAVHVAPFGILQVCVERLEDGDLHVIGYCHVVLNSVQSTQNQVEDTHRVPGNIQATFVKIK